MKALSTLTTLLIKIMAQMKKFKVNVVHKGAGSSAEIIEAVNVPEARAFAEARFPGCKIAGINTAN